MADLNHLSPHWAKPPARGKSFLLLCAFLSLIPGLQAENSYPLGRESGTRLIELRKKKNTVESEVATFTLTTIGSSGKTRNREILMVTRRNDFQRFDYLIRFLHPEDIAGTTFLSKETQEGAVDQYLYLPALGTVNRITGEALKTSFMGSDFTYEDLKKESTTDYEYAYVGDTRIGLRRTHKVVAVASTPENRRITGYARRILYLDQDSLEILKIEFFDATNRHEKTLEALAYGSEEVEGEAARPHRLMMTNHIRGTTSVMTLRKSKLNLPIESRLVDPNNLKEFSDSDFQTLLEKL